MKQAHQTQNIGNNEVNIYFSEDDPVKSICQLASKILEDRKTILILCAPDQVNQIDSSLWSFGRNRFIPHITSNDREFDFTRQPILITCQESNFNNANYLIFTDTMSSGFINNFERSFCFTKDEHAKNRIIQNLRGISKIKFYKKEGKKWIAESIQN